MKVTFADEARQEFAEAARWYAVEAGEVRATDFNNAIQRTVNWLVAHPFLGTPSPYNPACAGNTANVTVKRFQKLVHPRVCGEHATRG